MAFQFRPAVREGVGILAGVAGPSGSGKTFTALRMATGLAGGKRFAVIDTEAGRAKHYADQFTFDHGDLQPPFRPGAYLEAIIAAEEAGYPVVVVDSMSHEHAGDGGLLDWHEEELDRLAGSDYAKRERVKFTAWIKPKGEHKRMVSRLLQLRAHLILCFRAEQKAEPVRNREGKIEMVPKVLLSGFSDWIPVAEKNLLFELTLSFVLSPAAPGCPIPIKIQEQHRAFFPKDQPVTEAAGQQLAAWAAGTPQPCATLPADVAIAERIVLLPAAEREGARIELEERVRRARESGRSIAAITKAIRDWQPAKPKCPECGTAPCSTECSLQGRVPE